MRKALIAGLLVGLVACAANAVPFQVNPPAVTWVNTWDFQNGAQGWAIAGNAAATWVAPGTGPMLPDGAPSGSGGGSLYLPDKGYATMSVPTTDSYVIEADFYVPNLLPLTGFTNNYPGNSLQKCGITAISGATKKQRIYGRSDQAYDFGFKDYTVDNADRKLEDWALEDWDDLDAGVWDKAKAWDEVVTMRIDCNYSAPGKVRAYVYVPWAWPYWDGSASVMTPEGWYQLCNVNVSTDSNIDVIQVGQTLGDTSWTQAEVVAVRFLPEPTAILLLGLPLLLIRRRRA